MVYTGGDMKHDNDIALQSDQTEAERTPPKPFKPQRVDLTPEEPVNIGYAGGVRVPKPNA
jgi:hypothetical protein